MHTASVANLLEIKTSWFFFCEVLVVFSYEHIGSYEHVVSGAI
jgi:hypothetical protein